MKSLSVTIQMKAAEQYFPVVLFIMLYKVVLTFESVDEILKCDHSNESCRAVLSCGAVYYAVVTNQGTRNKSITYTLMFDRSHQGTHLCPSARAKVRILFVTSN